MKPRHLLPILLFLFAGSCNPEPDVEPAPPLESTLSINEWIVPWELTRPRDPFVAPDGSVFFCGQTGGYIGRLDPVTGDFMRFDLGEGAGPHNLIVDDRGFVWYAGNRRAHIGRLDPVSGEITVYPMPDPAANDPHTLAFNSKGDIWFTLQGANMVGRLDTTSGTVDLIPMKVTGARPYGIDLDSSDHPWVALFGTNRIAMINPETGNVSEFPLPRPKARPRRLVVTSDDAVWYVDYAGGYLGRYQPDTEVIQEWEMPDGADARPYGMALDARDRIWFVETGVDPNRFIGFDTKSRYFLPGVDIPSGGGAVRNMYFDPQTDAVWFGTDANTIGRAKLPG